MKLTKRILSVFLTILMLSSMSVLTMAAAITHEIDASAETTIAPTEYTSATSVYKKSSVEYTVDDAISVVDERLELAKSYLDGTTERTLTNTITYTMNFAKDGYYRFRMNGMYKTTAPTVYLSIDGGEEVTADYKLTSTDSTKIIKYIAVSAGQHTVTFRFYGGGASIKNIYVRNMQKDVGSDITRIPIIDYISTTNSSGTQSYTSNGVKYCIPVYSEQSSNLGSSTGLNNKYRINVAESGQYRVSAWCCRTKSTLYADVSIVGSDGRSIIARGIGEPKTSVTSTTPVTTSSFNLEAGVQNLHLRFHCETKDPLDFGKTYIFLYYIEIEKIDSIQSGATVLSDSKTVIEPEGVFYTDEGVTKTADSATIAAGKSAYFYLNVPTEDAYAVSFKYKAEENTHLDAKSLTTAIYDDTLVPTNGEYLTYTLSVPNLKAGSNRVQITTDKDVEIEKIFINKISDSTSLTAINNAETEAELEQAITSAQSALDVELTEMLNGIFYKKPVYNRLIKKDYTTFGEFVSEYNEAVLSEYKTPWVTLYIDGTKKLQLETGDIKLTASTGYLPKGSTMIAALYQNLEDDLKTLHNFAICEEVSQNTYDFLMDDVEILPENSYTLEFFYWDGLTRVSPIEVFNSVYEEIYVSTGGDDLSGDGTKLKPYATIQAALTKVDEINDYQWGDIIVNVADGTYTITETLVIDEKYSGKNGYNVIIRGEEGKQPEINGGIKIDNSGWIEGENGIWKAPLSGVNYVRNLYINGYPAVMAKSDRHYDNATTISDASKMSTTIHTLSSGEDVVQTQDIVLTNNATGISSDIVEKSDCGFWMSKEELGVDFEHPVGMEFVWPYTFEHHITPVIASKKTENEITFYMNDGLLGMRKDTVFKTGGSFYLQNAKELINKPGEFCYDKEDGYIYYYPYSYEDLTTADVYIGNVEGMVKVEGSSNTSKVSNITFENLAFRYGAYDFVSKYGYIGSQTEGILYTTSWSDGKVGSMAQFAVDNADNVNIKGCEFSCLGSAAVSMIDSVSNSKIEGNIIRDISGTGIIIGHPTHNRQRPGIDVCSYIDVTNNVIRRIASETFNNSAIIVYYEKFINILHNDIGVTPYTGIGAGWGWSGGSAYDHSDINISYNKIENIMNSLHDGGAIYTLGPIKNGIISNNYLKDHNSRNSGAMIYQDQGSAFIDIFSNVVLDSVLAINFNVSNPVTSYLSYYDNYSDTGTHRKLPADYEDRNLHYEEQTIVTGEGESLSDPKALEIYRNAGLEDEYKELLSKPGVEFPTAGRDLRITLPEPAPTDEVMLYSTDYDRETSTADLEMLNYADGMGIVITEGDKINFKLDIPKAGYYKIYLYAIGAGDTNRNNILVTGDAKEVVMYTDTYPYHPEEGSLTQSQLAIWYDKYRKYRICTAYFEAGEQDLTFTVKDPEDKVIIKELYYGELLQNIKPKGVNLIRVKNYYGVTGLYSNNYENNVAGYPSDGADYFVKGCVCTPANKTLTLTYKLNVEEAGTYKVTAGSWVGKNGPLTYQILIDGEVKAEGATKTYTRLHKSEDTQLSDLELPAGEVEIQLKAIGAPDTSYLYYLTFEKTN